VGLVSSECTRKSRKGRTVQVAHARRGTRRVVVCFALTLSPNQLKSLNRQELEYAITMLEESMASMKPNMKAIVEFRKKQKEYLQRVDLLEKSTRERDGIFSLLNELFSSQFSLFFYNFLIAARRVYENLRKKRLDEFMTGFSQITMKLKEM
jgi:structural maintenance of chromosome 4